MAPCGAPTTGQLAPDGPAQSGMGCRGGVASADGRCCRACPVDDSGYGESTAAVVQAVHQTLRRRLLCPRRQNVSESNCTAGAANRCEPITLVRSRWRNAAPTSMTTPRRQDCMSAPHFAVHQRIKLCNKLTFAAELPAPPGLPFMVARNWRGSDVV